MLRSVVPVPKAQTFTSPQQARKLLDEIEEVLAAGSTLVWAVPAFGADDDAASSLSEPPD